MKNNRILQDTLDTTFEIFKLFKFSPRRDAIFQVLKAEIAPGTPGFKDYVSDKVDCTRRFP